MLSLYNRKKTSAFWAVSLQTISIASFACNKSSLRSWGRHCHSPGHILPWTYVPEQNNGETGFSLCIILFSMTGLGTKIQPRVIWLRFGLQISSNWLKALISTSVVWSIPLTNTICMEDANVQEQEACPSTSSYAWQGLGESSICPSHFGVLPALRDLTWELQEFCLGRGLHFCPDDGKSCPYEEFLQVNTSVGLACPS